jgi:hypothetical protein
MEITALLFNLQNGYSKVAECDHGFILRINKLKATAAAPWYYRIFIQQLNFS